MAAPNASTFDLTPPTRPGTNDFNGIAKIDDANDPPDVQTMPNAAEWNTMAWLLLSIGRLMPVAALSATGATGAITAFAAAAKELTSSDITVAHPATGICEYTWTANTFPAAALKPTASLNTGPGMIYAESITNGVRVKTYNAAGAAADLDFTVSIF